MRLSRTLLIYCSLGLLWSACKSLKNNGPDPSADAAKDELVTMVDTLIQSALDTTQALLVIDTIPAPAPPRAPLEYMTVEEKAMLDEINLLRGDPNAYILHVDAYIASFISDPGWDAATKREEVQAANELIDELRTMEPLPPLRADESLYNVAVRHGEDMKVMEQVTHRGSDGSQPFQRIRDSTDLDGAENLVGGGIDVRESVLMLLVDGGVENRGHRRNLLDADWEYAACYRAGTIGDMTSTWVQLFAFPDIDEFAEEPIPGVKVQRSMASPSSPTASGDLLPGTDHSFLTNDEKEMVTEINLLRQNPKAYVPYVDEYVAYRRSVGAADDDFRFAAEELKTQLSLLGPMTLLQPNAALYQVAKQHGEDNRQHNQLEHTGSDGSDPFDRVKRSGLKNDVDERGYFSPNENLVGGESSVRRSVLVLLIDAGISSRGHRRALLNPKWQYVACYKIGTIENLPELRGSANDDMENCWVQLFAKN